MMYSNEAYRQQASELIEKSNGALNMEDFDNLQNAALNDNVTDEQFMLADRIVKTLFRAPWNDEILVPWNFFSTPVGEAIRNVAFRTERFVFVYELAKMADCSESYIYKLINEKKLKPQKRDNGKLVISESEANNYLLKKGKPTVAEYWRSRKEEDNELQS